MKFILYLISTAFLFASCNVNKEEDTSAFIPLSDTANAATSPLTGINNEGDPFIYWVEKKSATNQNMVVFTVYDKSKNGFGQSKDIPVTSGCNDGHGQGMPKVIFKKDGTMIVVYHRRIPTEKNTFAGKVYYSLSKDNGNSWSDPSIIHSDTAADNSHGFPAVAMLPDGEVAVIWLDGRNKLPYSEVYMATTKPNKGFEGERKIGGPACQCCKMELYVDQTQTLHALYRAIGDSSVRDIVHISSKDGKSFSNPVKISDDGWKIKGCPHAGPGMIQYKDSLHFAWFTMGKEKGIFHTKSPLEDTKYQKPRKISLNEFAKYPQLGILASGKLAMVWQEYESTGETGYNYIKGETYDGETIESYTFSSKNENATHPVVCQISGKDIVVYEKETDGKSVVGYMYMFN